MTHQRRFFSGRTDDADDRSALVVQPVVQQVANFCYGYHQTDDEATTKGRDTRDMKKTVDDANRDATASAARWPLRCNCRDSKCSQGSCDAHGVGNAAKRTWIANVGAITHR